jgi:8-oxo-dGTP pyrophosphatase MutT (NUDIX family)
MTFFIGTGLVAVQGDKYILVQETRHDKAGLFNLPAGTLEIHEDLIQCVTREAKEETGVDVAIEHFVGIYQAVMTSENNVLFTVFASTIPDDAVFQSVEHDTIRAFAYDEVVALNEAGQLRSPIVLKAIDDYRSGQRLSLSVVQSWHVEHLGSITVEKDH